MNREIKFRAWSKTKGIMVYAIPVWKGHTGCVLDGWDDYHADEMGECQQFTGLTDKNGREIYEGDIVEAALYRSTSRFTVEWKSIANHSSFGAGTHNLTVIGNLHENPELLAA